MTESLLPPILQELREAILAKTPEIGPQLHELSPLGPYFYAWQAAAKEFPYLTGCCDVNGDDDPSDGVMLERLTEIEGIVQEMLAAVDHAREAPQGREARPLVDAPPCRYCGAFATAQERQACRRRRGYE